MKIYNSIDEFAKTGYESHVALGFFDGVHHGHRAVIRDCTVEKGNCRSVVLTFSESPARLLGNTGVRLITGNNKKAELIAALGVDALIFADFMQIKDLSAEEFVSEVLAKRLRAKKVCCGSNYRFGKNGAGDADALKKLCAERGIAVSVAGTVDCDGRTVSSSAVRALLQDGDIPAVNRMLGYAYTIGGRIDSGNHFGTKMGFPTVNLPIGEGLAVPRYGVYAAWITVGGRRYRGATNIGVHPTVGENPRPLCESFLLDFEGNIYGEEAICEPVRFIRPEKEFASVDELTAQVGRDIEKIKEILK